MDASLKCCAFAIACIALATCCVSCNPSSTSVTHDGGPKPLGSTIEENHESRQDQQVPEKIRVEEVERFLDSLEVSGTGFGSHFFNDYYPAQNPWFAGEFPVSVIIAQVKSGATYIEEFRIGPHRFRRDRPSEAYLVLERIH